MKVLHVPASLNKPFEVLDIPDDDLAAMQNLVGGSIEAYPVPTRDIMVYINESGLIDNLPYNPRAESLVQTLWANVERKPNEAPLAGDVVVCGGTDDDGGQLDIPDYIVTAMRKPNPYGRLA